MIRRPGTILTLLTALNLLNYLDRFVLSAVLPKVQDDLHLSNFLAGSLATVFLIGYFTTSPIFGVLADRSRPARRGLMAVGVGVWSLATIASGLSTGAPSLVAARTFVGIGEASYATIAPAIIDEVAPPAKKGRWMSIFYMATPVGSALGFLIGGAVETATHDWRQAFFVAGVPGVLLALTCLALAETSAGGQGGERPRSPRSPGVLEVAAGEPGAKRRAERGPWSSSPSKEEMPLSAMRSAAYLAGNPLYRATTLGYAAFTFAMGGFAFWAPKYLHARYSMETGHASFVFGLVTVVAGIAGTFAGGALADRAARGAKDEAGIARANLVVCAVSAAVGAPLAAAAIAAPTSNLFFLLVFPCEVALFLQSGPVNVALLRSVPEGLRASAMAVSIWAIHFLGDLWSPPLMGLVADHAPIEWAMFAVPLFFAVGGWIWWHGRLARTSHRAVPA